MKARPTIYDVASCAGVSLKTVSRVINGEPSVRRNTREAVEKAIRKLDYQPSISARSLASGRSRLIGMIGDNPSAGYVGELLKGALQACTERGYHLVLVPMGDRLRPAARGVRETAVFTRLDGAILAPPGCDDPELLSELERLRVPYVRISPDLQPARSACVRLDEREAAAAMTAALWRQGHRQIAFVRAPASHAAASRRLEGFLEVMNGHGICTAAAYLEQGDFTVASGMASGRRLLSLAQRPTAIFASNDDMAVGVLMAAYERGIEVPAQLSIAGFDDTPVSTSVHPMLTTVRQPVAEMAARAVRALLEEGRGCQLVPTAVAYDIVCRGSTAAAPFEDPGERFGASDAGPPGREFADAATRSAREQLV